MFLFPRLCRLPLAIREHLWREIGGINIKVGAKSFSFSPTLLRTVRRPRNPKISSKMPSVDTVKPILKFTKTIPEAYTPTKGSIKAAGYDLRSAYDYVVEPNGKQIVDTGIKIELPEGCYGRIAPRSGLAAKNFIDVGAGVVDEDYRGLIKVVLFNHSSTPFDVKKGDRIAQLICERIFYPEIVEVTEVDETARGEGGFGSTGTN